MGSGRRKRARLSCCAGCKDPESFEQALSDAQEVFRLAKARGMQALRVLDIGGGYPGDRLGFEKIAPGLAEKLGRLFPASEYPEANSSC